jgi:DNA-binding Lrp family transcriptional regulator
MPSAFVMINTEVGAEKEVLERLRRLADIKESYAVFGIYDIVAKIEADSMEKLKEIIDWRIRRLDKVRSTLTMIVTESKH